MEDEKFKIRSYGWTELALCYNPNLHPNSASLVTSLGSKKRKTG